jgi:hypothetical protein
VAETFLKMGNTTCHQDVPQLRPQYKCSALWKSDIVIAF